MDEHVNERVGVSLMSNEIEIVVVEAEVQRQVRNI